MPSSPPSAALRSQLRKKILKRISQGLMPEGELRYNQYA